MKIKLQTIYCFAGVLLLFSLAACKNKTAADQSTPDLNISYKYDWKEVEKMEEQGLGNSIIEKSSEILQKALEENNAIQIFKALAYRSKYIDKIEENAQLKIINDFENQIKSANQPLKSILQSAVAELYVQYLEQNRWQFQNRSTLLDFNEKDLRSWSLYKIRDQIAKTYRQSLQATEVLQSVPLEKFKKILLLADSNNFKYRPSLYDLLADRALNYFEKEDQNISSFGKKIKNDNRLFLPAEAFVKLSFETADTTSNRYNTIQILQQLISNHLGNTSAKSLLIERELQRLEYAYSITTLENKSQLYLEALNRLAKRYNEHYPQIYFAQAQFYYQQAQKSSKEIANREQEPLVKAFELCEKIEKSGADIVHKASLLKDKILQKSLRLTLPEVVIPQEEITLKLNYKNYHKLYFRLYKLPLLEAHSNRISNTLEKGRKMLEERQAIRKWSLSLSAHQDFQEHQIETTINALEEGTYTLIASADSTFNMDSSRLAFADFQSSKIAYFFRKNTAGEAEIYVRDRTSGTALQQAELHILASAYDNERHQYTWENKATFKAKQEGYILIQNMIKGNYRFYITLGKDSLWGDHYYRFYKNRAAQKVKLSTHLFTDRAIYKAGDIVHFKGIVVASEAGDKSVKAGYQQKVKLFNANGESIGEKEVKSNEYGSYHGSFTLPEGDLNGRYQISDQHGSVNFYVEDYKRPSFEVVFDSIKEAAKLGEEIQVSGKVERFSGGQTGPAVIQYHILRKSRFPFRHLSRSYGIPQKSVELAAGEIRTDERGHFSFTFFAEASERNIQRNHAIENFEINVSAVIPSGEVQFQNKTIQLGHQDIYLSTNIGDRTDIKALQNLVVFAKTMNGRKVDRRINIELWKLKERKGAVEDLEKSQKLLSNNIRTNQPIALIRDLKTGAYLIKLKGEDRFGKSISFEQRLVLYDTADHHPPRFKKLWFQPLKEKSKVGEKYAFLLGSSLKALNLLYEIELRGEIVHSEWLNLDEEQRRISFDIPEEYRGGFSIHLSGVQQNEFMHKSTDVALPYDNKELKMKLSSYRDLVEPGSKEKWELKLSRADGGKLDAEVMLGMYSQDLDVFRKLDWTFDLYRQHPGKLAWTATTFGDTYSRLFGKIKYSKAPLSKVKLPRLNWFGFYLGAGRYSSSGEVYLLAEEMDMRGEKIEVKQKNKASLSKTSKKIIKSNSNKQLVSFRKNFRETAFFYPTKYNKTDGSLSFEFSMPDALTKWRFMALAHTKSLAKGKFEYSIRSQKKLMLFPNLPRFIRKGDRFNFRGMLENNSDKVQEVKLTLRFFDALNNQPLDVFVGQGKSKSLQLSPSSTQDFSWELKLPQKLSLLKYQLIAEGETISDGQEGIIPILPRKKLITESLPMSVRGNTERTFLFPSLLNLKEKDIEPLAFSIEVSANPSWYAVQALPYLADGNSNNSEAVFHKIFANSIARKIVRQNEKIKEVFSLWRTLTPDELLSELEQNPELKEVLPEETPWLPSAKIEKQQRQRIALLFEANNMQHNLGQAINRLLELQLPDGGWPWFNKMRSSRQITSAIVKGFGMLKQMGINFEQAEAIDSAIEAALAYLDRSALERYHQDRKRYSNQGTFSFRPADIEYLYLRSVFPEHALKDSTAFIHYLDLAQKKWKDQNIMMKAELALALNHMSENETLAKQILFSLKEHAIRDSSMGMYWKNNNRAWHWYSAKVESQAMVMMAFDEVLQDQKSVEEMKIWLLKQKQTQAWKSSRATALAVYSILMQGENLLSNAQELSVKLGKQELHISDEASPGTVYFKKQYGKEELKPEMGRVEIKNEGNSIVWGAAYLQYYKDFDQLEAKAESKLKVHKNLFKIAYQDAAKVAIPIDRERLSLGDRIMVRLRIENDRDMDFVHLKDPAVMALEPTTTLSAYRAQDALYYYRSFSGSATNFFFEQLPKGTHVIEYEMKVTQSGDFACGAAVLQSYYAPEFKAYSKGRRIKIFAD